MLTKEEIKKLLKQKGMTYSDLSQKTNIPLGTLKNLFSTKSRDIQPRLDTLNAIMEALEIKTVLPTEDDGLTIPENLQNIRFAFHDGLDGLTQEDIDEVSRYVEFLKSKKKK